jgi:hypothetical protein
MEDEDPDVRLRASGGVSDRLFYSLLMVMAIYLIVVLSGCGYLYRVTASSDDTNVTGDFMIGEPHENTTNLEVQKDSGLQGSDRFDVQSRNESTRTDRID